jgi:hypothetical protein
MQCLFGYRHLQTTALDFDLMKVKMQSDETVLNAECKNVSALLVCFDKSNLCTAEV